MRMRHYLLLDVLLMISLLLALPSHAQPPLPAGASVREVIYFGAAGPVRLRLQITVDGRSVDDAWKEATNALFDLCDRNGDGFLDVSERAAFVEPVRKSRGEFELIQEAGRSQPLRLTFPAKEEKISRQAFLDALRASGNGSINFSVLPPRADYLQLSSALFKLLDRDGDGRLSMDELKAARERLASLDVNEDEFISTEELLGNTIASPPGIPRPVRAGMRAAGARTDESKDLVFLTAEGNQAVKQLLAARSSPRATTLKLAEFGGDAKKFAALDQDGNGALDTTELAAWLRQPPDFQLVVSFPGGKLVPVVGANQSSRSHFMSDGHFLAHFLGSGFEFERPGRSPTKDWEQEAVRLRKQFKELAKETEVIERKQIEGQSPMLALFDLARRKDAEKLTLNELESSMKALKPLANCRVDLVFQDQGNGLFELLDTNGDGRLSPRELINAPTVLQLYAATDGKIGPKDLLRQFNVRWSVQPIPVGVLFTPLQAAEAQPTAPPVMLPEWFTRMDRNGDGEVSLREFLGPIDLFRKLDSNGDGLISPDEALAAGK